VVDRRTFIAGVAGDLLAAPLAAKAQSATQDVASEEYARSSAAQNAKNESSKRPEKSKRLKTRTLRSNDWHYYRGAGHHIGSPPWSTGASISYRRQHHG